MSVSIASALSVRLSFDSSVWIDAGMRRIGRGSPRSLGDSGRRATARRRRRRTRSGLCAGPRRAGEAASGSISSRCARAIAPTRAAVSSRPATSKAIDVAGHQLVADDLGHVVDRLRPGRRLIARVGRGDRAAGRSIAPGVSCRSDLLVADPERRAPEEAQPATRPREAASAEGVLVGSSPWMFRVSMIPNISRIATAPM